MKNLKLSICLPVYNQAEELERLLANLVPQLISGVEVIIRDDSQNNDSELVAKKYGISKYFHGQKEGIDKALLFLFEKAEGEFIWWIGDDDVAPDSIKKVLGAIGPEIDFIWANNQIIGNLGLAVDMPVDGIIEKNRFIELAGTGLGFISSCIFRKSAAEKNLEKSKEYVGSEFVSLYLVLSAISSGGASNVYYLRGPVIICHPATSSEIKVKTAKGGEINNAAFQVFGINFKEIIEKFPFNKKSKRIVIKNSFAQTWRGVLVGSVGGWDTTKGKNWKILKYFWAYPEAYVAFILFSLPLGLIKILFGIYKIFFNERKWVFGKKGPKNK